ncbi:tetratricopeptide repeat protein [Paraburkholderia sp. Tr-20389]|uniref:tetratricopeptide repeat protein n=1 Tax=Paraburkholderia sp. Tr-20389 TaxID=2703903 RepID=UPI001980C21F|nr:tetratricopeptide repeat protein [Paraburkholderia sp. Tr-20389]MBN3752292.1 tetratricopeptide repeat protein [Paraburkholderia sp. Tr-20389]
MRIFGISLYVIIALFFAVHAVRTQQNMYWLLILFLFPGLGSLVYFFVIYLPALRQSRGAMAATKAISQLVDPNRAVREARTDFDRAPTVAHRMRLGAALLDAGNASEALEHYQAAASGPFSSDPALLQGLARAQFANGDAAASRDTLETLFTVDPLARRRPEPSLLNARVQAAIGAPGTRAAFEMALASASDAAPRCLYADWLVAQPDDADRQRARELYAEIVHDARHWPRHAREHNSEWLQRAQAALSR